MVWVGYFLDAVADEAGVGLALLRQIERDWFQARHAVSGRRRDLHAAAAIDMLAAAPLLSATSLAQLLGIVSEMTHRSKRRLYGLKHLAPLRDATAPPRRPWPGRRPGRPRAVRVEDSEMTTAETTPRLALFPPLPPLARREFDFSDIDQLLALTDQAIRRAQNVLGERSKCTTPAE